MDKDDNAVWRRCRVVNFPTIFCENPIRDNEKLVDYDLDVKLAGWKQEFMLLLMEYYGRYLEEGLKPTENIQSVISSYKERHETEILRFLNEYTVKEEGEYVWYGDLYENLRMWYIDMYGTDDVNKAKFKKEMERHLGIAKYLKRENKTKLGFENVKFLQEKFGEDVPDAKEGYTTVHFANGNSITY